MLDAFLSRHKLPYNDLHIPHRNVRAHAHETLELILNSDTSFYRCLSLRVFQQLGDHYDRLECYAAQTNISIVKMVRCFGAHKHSIGSHGKNKTSFWLTVKDTFGIATL